MASLMQDWLLSFIKQELEKAIDWKKSEAYDTNDRSKDYSYVKDEEHTSSNHRIARRSITDDGSNLRVSIDLSIGCEHAVQIMKYLEYEHPVKAMISDSHTSIVAKFSKVATDLYEQSNHGRRITKITTGGIISLCRCEIVATTYGPDSERLSLLITEFKYRGCGGSSTIGRPEPIEQKPEVECYIKDMIEAKNSEANYRNQQQSKRAFNSEEALSEIDDKSAVFQTQASRIRYQPYCDSQLTEDMRDENHEAEKIRGVNSDGPRAPTAAKLANRTSGLEVNTESMLTNRKRVQKGSSNATCAHTSSNEATEMSVTELEPKAAKSKNIRSEKKKKSRSKNSKGLPKPMDLGESLKNLDEAPIVPEWMPIRAITRRSCLIPSDQMKLLSRRESWMPSEPGVQFPLANIPIKVLNELKKSSQKHNERRYETGVYGALNGHVQQSEKLGDHPSSQLGISQLAELESLSSDVLSWAATNPDVANGGLPPDSSFLQDHLSDKLGCSQRQQHDYKATKNASNHETATNHLLIGEPSSERRPDNADEDSGLEMCLPGEMRSQASHSSANFGNNAKLTIREEQEIGNSGCQPDESHHSKLQLDPHSYWEVEKRNRGDLGHEFSISGHHSNQNPPENDSKMIVPNTPSHEVNRTRRLSGREIANDHKQFKSQGENETISNPSGSCPAAEKIAHSKDNTAILQIGAIDSNLTPSASVNNSYLGYQEREREHRTGDYNTMGSHKKLKTQHSAYEPIQNSPAFLESACQAQEAKRDFLHMLAATKMNNSFADGTCKSSYVTGQPKERVSQSTPEYASILPTKMKNALPNKDRSGPNSSGSVQSQSSAHNSKTITFQSMSQGISEGFYEPAAATKLSTETVSAFTGQGNEKPCGSARTNPRSPLVNNVVYVTFREVYPDYTGDLKHFLGICRLIEISQWTGTAQHRSLWDDFIVKHITDYGPYLISCNAAEEKPITYEQYYRDRVDEPCHNKRVLTPESLREALDLNTSVSSANSIGINNFQPLNHSVKRVVGGSKTSSRRRKGKKMGYLSSSPTSIQWKRDSNYIARAEVRPSLVGSIHTSPRSGKTGNQQKFPHSATRNSADDFSGQREVYQAYNNSTGTSRNSSKSRKHESTNSTAPFASSRLGSNLVVQGGNAGHSVQTPNSERSWQKDQHRRSKPLPAPLYHTKKSTKAHLMSPLPFPLSSSSSIKSLSLSGPSIQLQARSDIDDDAKLPPLQRSTEHDRARVKNVPNYSSSSVPDSSPPPTSTAVVRCFDEKIAMPTRQTNESGTKATVSSLPIPSTTNQILQQKLLAEQNSAQKDNGIGKLKETKTDFKTNSVSSNMWWREDHTVFKEFVLGYAQMKNIDGSLGMPVADLQASKSMGTYKWKCDRAGDEDSRHGNRESSRQRKKWSIGILSWKL